MRLQLALNVDDLDGAIDFYSRMFDTRPAKIEAGYANWEIANPPLKLVLFESKTESSGPLNHLGVETETTTEVKHAAGRFETVGLQATDVEETVCCFAEKTETWLTAPDGNRWEWYVKRGNVQPSTGAGCG